MNAITHTHFDQAKCEAFTGKMVTALNHAALMLMTSVGHRTGLFDTFARPPSTTSEGLAAAAGLSERYVREWLAVMVTSGVVEYDPLARTYSLPAEHAAVLTREAEFNLAVPSQFIATAAGVEDRIVERFRDGGGLQYHHCGRFYTVMAEDSQQSVVNALFDHILPLVPGLTDKLERGIEVADVGCGAGRALFKLARRFPNSRFIGFDLCADAFEDTANQAVELGLNNLNFKACDLTEAGHLGLFDLVLAFDAIHDQKDPAGVLKSVRRSLHPAGTFLMQDIGGSSYLENNINNPFAPMLYMMSTTHCTPVSLGQGGAGLGTMWGVELAERMLKEAGFNRIQMSRLAHDPVNAYFVCRPDPERA
ncbi:class I SAM-dependent methyltransferase [Asticcacaulis sp. ZE23SCel15]|uniref:class I SAM-dependent methyltransferase n=1 Tax=Asticcacaulis sp. ZE23SCel15 TaxID=3059027 RepID=UPI00265D84CF|nr:class I SAM-dependent methyltransferase [Asticcacaulis sp. ZE23SCel15]WKL57431.1 class I SAM-dependent methyltransferase [Asticcacaulis sp. ZE23SCel15]